MPIALPTTRSTPTTSLATKTTLLYGQPKIGKSTFASQFPDALFLECEPGLGELSVFKIPTYTWDDFLAACRLVAAGEHNFRTIVVDTADNAFRSCSEHVCAKHNIEYEGDLPHGKGWSFVKSEWHRVLTRLASLPYGLVLISHAVDRQIETRTGEYTKTVPSLPDRARQVVLGLVDMILFCDTVARKDERGQTAVQRVIRTKPHPTYEAGDRTGRLPDTLPLDYAAFARCFEAPATAAPVLARTTPGATAGSAPDTNASTARKDTAR
ncbi:MAG: ATP-binding protein [Phycisphaeraceae bacterium]|nr:ATP-binding protein [Phycisphaeraceae bacterium]